MLKKSFILVLILAVFYSANIANAKDEIQDILTKFNNYRFGSVYIYKVRDAKEILAMREADRAAASGFVKIDQSVINNIEKKYDKLAISIIRSGVLGNKSKVVIKGDLADNGYKKINNSDLDKLYNKYKQDMVGGAVEYKNEVYLVTMPPEKGELPTEIIGMVIFEKTKSRAKKMKSIKSQLERVNSDLIYSKRRMMFTDIEIDRPSADNPNVMEKETINLYDLANNYLRQKIVNVTLEARALEDNMWAPKTVGTAKPLLAGNNVTGKDIQLFKRISSGDAFDANAKSYELQISADKISFTAYKQAEIKKASSRKKRSSRVSKDTTATTSKKRPKRSKKVKSVIPNNSSLPLWGVEMKYGIDGINMPSMWSERSTLSVFWEQAKVGIILPVGDISALEDDVNLFGHDRKFTNAGIGVAADLDFGFPLIKNSNVFNLSLAYVFGDAQEAVYQTRTNVDDIGFKDDKTDYLIRANAQLLYTFGVAIDSDYLLRFGVGGGFYSLEEWKYETPSSDDKKDDTFKEDITYLNSKTRAKSSIIGRVEFLVKNTSTPYGASLNYFDGTLQIDGFALFPVIPNTFFIKASVKGNTIVRDTRNDWEVNSLFIPNLNFIYRF